MNLTKGENPLAKETYNSMYGSTRKLSANQYLVEFILKRRAKTKNIVLPDFFWKHPSNEYVYWEGAMNFELRKSASLLSIYPMDVIMAVLKSPEGSNILSFVNKRFNTLCAEENRKKKLRKTAKSDTIIVDNVDDVEVDPNTKPRKRNQRDTSSSKKSKLGKLK